MRVSLKQPCQNKDLNLVEKLWHTCCSPVAFTLQPFDLRKSLQVDRCAKPVEIFLRDLAVVGK